MSHNITERDGLFTVRKPAWHRLGAVLDEYPTREQAQKIAHPWEPITAPVFAEVPYVGEDGELGTRMEEIDGYRSVVRSDTNALLGVVSDTYETVTNAEMYDIAEAIEGEAHGSVMFETGGSLKGGAKVWLLIRLRDPLVIGNDSKTATIPYYALQNSHDGSGSFRGQATMTRIVCDNTAKAADLDARVRGTEFVFRHTRNVRDRIAEARQALAGWRESVEDYRMFMEHLIDEPISTNQKLQFLDKFIPVPPPATASDRVMNNVGKARDEWLGIWNGETSEGLQQTRYKLVQTSIEYLNHMRAARSDESRFQRAYLTRDRLTQDAVKIAQAV